MTEVSPSDNKMLLVLVFVGIPLALATGVFGGYIVRPPTPTALRTALDESEAKIAQLQRKLDDLGSKTLTQQPDAREKNHAVRMDRDGEFRDWGDLAALPQYLGPGSPFVRFYEAFQEEVKAAEKEDPLNMWSCPLLFFRTPTLAPEAVFNSSVTGEGNSFS